MMYERLRIRTLEVAGLTPSLIAMRLPINQNIADRTLEKDLNLASKLIKRGDDHAKCIRGCIVWCEMSCQVGWLLEYLTYRIGVECLSSSSSMHNELKGLHAEELATAKQEDLPEKIYTRIEMISYQTLRRIYLQRRKHRHPDFRIFCGWIETVPYFDELIYPEGNNANTIN